MTAPAQQDAAGDDDQVVDPSSTGRTTQPPPTPTPHRLERLVVAVIDCGHGAAFPNTNASAR